MSAKRVSAWGAIEWVSLFATAAGCGVHDSGSDPSIRDSTPEINTATRDAAASDSSGVDAAASGAATTDAAASDAGVDDAAMSDAATGDASDACVSPKVICESACVDTQTDPNHCGTCGNVCLGGGVCAAGVCVGRTAAMTGPGLSDCGANSDERCGESLPVTGGLFYRGTDQTKPATVSDFGLDKFEVTVGRFRKFVEATVGGWQPAAGSGKHVHVNNGEGLANTTGGYEPGWKASWASALPTTKALWDSNLSCSSSSPAQHTWTSEVAYGEKRPITCVSWYALYAFCIWDGGFLPSEAEWEYAAAGGSEERTYPWGSQVPDTSLAVYGTTAPSGAANVGSKPAGDGRWGHRDLAGNAWEWTFDWSSTLSTSCVDCTNTGGFRVARVVRGGAFNFTALGLTAAYRTRSDYPTTRASGNGGRCARTP